MSARLRGRTAHNRGKKSSPEAIEKNRQAKLGKKASPATKEKMRVRMTGNTINQGRKHTPEEREKLRHYKHTPEQREKMRLSSLGRKHTPEAREKMSRAALGNTRGLGKTPSPEKREKLRQAMTGKKHSLEQNEKHRQAMLGRTYSPEVYDGRKKTFILTSPSGEVYQVHGLKIFCQEHSLNRSHITQVAKGRAPHHKGWTAHYP